MKGHGDHTIFIRGMDDKLFVVLVYVDDILLASTDDDEVNEVKHQLSFAFKLRDLGPPKFFIGSLNQRKYVLDLLEYTGFSRCKPSSVPMEPNQKISQDDGTLLPNGKPYRQLLGKLQYLTITRPDITFAVSKLAQYSSAPTDVHLQAIHKILRYLKGTIGQSLFYGTEQNFDIRGYTDSDWGGVLTREDQLLAMLCLWVILWFHGVLRGKILCLRARQKLNTEQCVLLQRS